MKKGIGNLPPTIKEEMGMKQPLIESDEIVWIGKKVPHSILEQFENGKEKYEKSIAFKTAIDALLSGKSEYQVIDMLVEVITMYKFSLSSLNCEVMDYLKEKNKLDQ